ncbi:T9SS type A sorting domain-containing protein [candidate division WOR-3 bacterium]|nr:T9SS type A sorting domain-containing protein [candidate division WOR-3 bacterium]
MRKILVLVCFMVMMGLWASEGVLLELKPSIDGRVSEYRVVKDLPSKPESSILQKGSRDINDANYCIQYDSENWTYYCPRPCEDSMVVRFVPPERCSLVAFTWIGYNDATGATGQPVGVFAAMANPSEDYSTYPGVNEYHTAPLVHPLGNILWSGMTSAPGNMVWDTVNVDPGVYVGDSTFFCGYSGINPTDTIACLAESWIPMPAVIDIHTYQFNADAFAADSGAWFCYYYTGDDEALQFGIRAYVYVIPPPPRPIVRAEELPYSYDTTARTVNVYGRDWDPDSCGIVEMILTYSVNGGPEDTLVSTTPVEGDSTEGIWQLNIPGVNVSDTIDYYVIGRNVCNLTDTTPTYTYTILQGTPGHFLYVDNDNHTYDPLPSQYGEIMDVWDYDVYGAPDSSVLCFYANGINDTSKTIIWRDWGCLDLGQGANYGLGGDGILHPDSAWIKLLLDNGGHFWLSDEDQGYGLGICPNYGQQSVPEGHWVREYLGIQGMYDDNPALAGKGTILYGDPSDPVIGDLFSGIGYQTAGQIYIAPYAPLYNDLSAAYVGNYDSLQTGAVMNMFDAAGLIPSYRYTGPSDTYKVYNDFWPFDYICNPADSLEIDSVAVDSLVEDVLYWFGIRWVGISDRTLEPGKVVKLLPMNPVTRDAMIRFSLPMKMMVTLSIYDNTGRLIKNLVNGTRNAGLNTVRWDGKDSEGNSVANGVYFYRLSAGGKHLSDKMVVVR